MTGNPSEAGVQPRGRRAVKAVEPTGRNLGRPSQQARKTDDLDLLIGRRLRERRILLAISQDELARRIGLSFQQRVPRAVHGDALEMCVDRGQQAGNLYLATLPKPMESPCTVFAAAPRE